MNLVKITKASTIVFCLCFLAIGTAWAQKGKEAKEKDDDEKKVEMKDLPKAVQQTVQQQTKGATIKGFSKEVENGKTFYEVETTIGGHGKDMLIDPSGKVVEVEEEIDIPSLPAGVQAEVKKSLGTAKVLKFESVTKGGTLAGYEALVEKGGKKSEITLGTDGKVPAKKK